MIFLSVLLVITLISLLIWHYITKVPHGRVEFKSGLVLKFIKTYEGNDIFFLRKSYADMNSRKNYNTSLPVNHISDIKIPTSKGNIGARLYQQEKNSHQPLIIFIHGGGWCIGSVDTHDEVTRRLCIKSGFPVLSIEYTLSPEVKYPGALDEIFEVVDWTKNNAELLSADINKLMIIGDSAGGNLTLTTALKMIEAGTQDRMACIVPVYPVTDFSPNKGGSFKDYSEGYVLTKHLMDLFNANYLTGKENLKDPFLAPKNSTRLLELPPTFILTAGLDPLRDEAEVFANQQKKNGHPTNFKRYDSALHGFYGKSDFGKKGLVAIDDTVAFMKKYA